MIALDTSAIVAIALDEAAAETFRRALHDDAGWIGQRGEALALGKRDPKCLLVKVPNVP